MTKQLPRVGDYVRILKAPGYPGVERGDVGKVVGDYWLQKDGSLNVDTVSLAPDTHFVNLNFSPNELEPVSEETLISRRFSSDPQKQRDFRCYEFLSGR